MIKAIFSLFFMMFFLATLYTGFIKETNIQIIFGVLTIVNLIGAMAEHIIDKFKNK